MFQVLRQGYVSERGKLVNIGADAGEGDEVPKVIDVNGTESGFGGRQLEAVLAKTREEDSDGL